MCGSLVLTVEDQQLVPYINTPVRTVSHIYTVAIIPNIALNKYTRRGFNISIGFPVVSIQV